VYTCQFKVSKCYIIRQLLSVQGYISDANELVFRGHFRRIVNELREKLWFAFISLFSDSIFVVGL
jgi:hypothetical protein